MIESEKKRIRKEFQPLTIAVSLKIMTPNSPANQVYNRWQMNMILTVGVLRW